MKRKTSSKKVARRVSPRGVSERAIDEILLRPYAWTVAQDANGRFTARIADLPGCATDGATRAEALKNLEDAAHDWVRGALEDGFPVPQPLEREAASGKILLRLPRTLHRRVQDLAALDGVSANTFIVSAISGHAGAVELANGVVERLRHSFSGAMSGQTASTTSSAQLFQYGPTGSAVTSGQYVQ